MLEKTSLAPITRVNKEAIAAGFYSTPVGRMVGAAQDAKAQKKEEAEPVAKAPATTLGISEEALGILQSIDEKLKDVLKALEVTRVKEELAAEEAAQETAAPEIAPPATGGEEGGGGLMKKFGKWFALIGVIVAQVAYPIYQVIKGLIEKIKEMGGKIFDFFKEKVIPFFTETIPEFFTETIPEFFTETLPEMFFKGVDFVKEKFNSVIDGITEFISGIRSKVADFLVSLADSKVAQLLLPDSARDGIKSFAEKIRGSKAGEMAKEESAAKQTGKALEEQRVAAEKAAGPGAAAATAEGKPGALKTSIFAGEPVGKTLSEKQMKEAADIIQRGGAVPPDVINLYNKQIKEQGGAPSAAPTPGGGGGAAPVPAASAAVPPAPSAGAAVAAGSMAASAPEPMAQNAVNASSQQSMDVKQKADADPTNPVANVPDVSPNLGNIANLWYYDAEALA